MFIKIVSFQEKLQYRIAQWSRTWTVRTRKLDLSLCSLFGNDVRIDLMCKMKKIIIPTTGLWEILHWFLCLFQSSPTGLIRSKLKTKVHSFPVFSGKRTAIWISLPIHPRSRMNVSTCSWEVSKIKHVDTSVTNLLASLVIVLISYMLCISDQNYIKAEKSGRMNNACGYKH